MSSALPRQRIIDKVFDGVGSPALYIFSRTNIFFDPTIKLQYTYNPKKVLTLLEEERVYMKNKTLYDIEGKGVEFTLIIRSKIPEDFAIAEISAEEL